MYYTAEDLNDIISVAVANNIADMQERMFGLSESPDQAVRDSYVSSNADALIEILDSDTRGKLALERLAEIINDAFGMTEKKEEKKMSPMQKAIEAAKNLSVRTTDLERKRFIESKTRYFTDEQRNSAESKIDQMIEWAKQNGGSVDIWTDGETATMHTDVPGNFTAEEVEFLLRDLGVKEEKPTAEPYSYFHDTKEQHERCLHCKDNDNWDDFE